MDINRITRKIRLDSRHDAVKYQLVTELIFLRKQSIIESDLTYIALLLEWGAMPLKQFCNDVVITLFGIDSLKDVEKHPVRVQTIRNRLSLLEKRGLVVKQGKGKKIIAFNPAIKIETTGNILLDYNFLYVEAKESKESYTRVSPEVAAL